MSLLRFTDGVDTLDDADLLYMQQQSILQFATTAARDTALTGDSAPITGQIVQVLDDGTIYRYDGAAWKVWRGVAQRGDLSGATIPTSGSATAGVLLASFALKSGGVYRVSGMLDHSYSWKLTTDVSAGSLSGRVGVQGQAAAYTFDKTSATSVLTLTLGSSLLSGQVSASADCNWRLYGYNSGTAATLNAPAALSVERVG